MRQSHSLLIAGAFVVLAGTLHAQGKETNNLKTNTAKMETQKLTDNKQLIRNLYENILNQRHLELLNSVIDDKYVGARGEKGPDGLKQTVGPLIAAFPDIQWQVEELLAEGNKVVVRWKWTGTFQNSFRGVAPNQKKMTNEAIAVYEFENDKVVRSWIQSDQLGFLVQADVIPTSLIPGAPKK